MAQFAKVVFNLPIRKSFFYRVPEEEAHALQVGQRVRAPFRNRILVGVVVEVHGDVPPSITVKPIKTIIDSQPLYTDELLRLGEWMSDYYYCSLGESLLTMIPAARGKPSRSASSPVSDEAERHSTAHQNSDAASVDAEEESERVAVAAMQIDTAAPPSSMATTPSFASQSTTSPPSLNRAQQAALERITASDQRLLYLYGVTGSGKSELLLYTAQRYIEQGQGVILLVPEISLALQMARMLSDRYPLEYALLHSRMSNAERVAEWVRIAEGKVRLVVGVRSAVFAPLGNIGAIIIDEEQDGAYKSSFTPRYHARHVAMWRAAQHGARLLLASATPSLEAWHQIESGRIERLSLTERVGGARQPQIEVVAMQQERRIISGTLQNAIIETVEAQKQVILLHNRRGYGRTLLCASCGYTQQCPHCSVSMIYHQQSQIMVCHYCATTETKKTSCPDCQSIEIGFASFGTERVEQELRQIFPQFRIARIDTDTVRQRHTLGELLSAFARREIDILIGTQIVAKGLNFAAVELVGIVLADSSLTLPDFRAEEQTFMLLTQVAGRAGRFSEQGRVIIQTYRPENRVIQSVCNHDLAGYYRFELEQRQQLSFPPYARIIRIVTRSKSEAQAEEMAARLHRRLQSQPQKPAHIYGPIPCAIAKIANQYRYQLMVSDPSFAVTHRAIAAVLHGSAEQQRDQRTSGQAGIKSTGGGYIEVDVDPLRVL